MRFLPAALVVCSLVAFGFLAYTLLNLDRLGIRFAHPRVYVEAGLGVGFLVAAWLLSR